MRARFAAAIMFLVLASPRGAAAGDASGEVALDFLRAGSESGPGGGDPSSITAQEAGIRVRLLGHEIDRRLTVEVDYRGREPIGGDVETVKLRTLYTGELRFEVAPHFITLGAGRFIPPAAVFLPVDGAHGQIEVDRVTIAAFGGRRAITTSMRNVDFSDLLPAGGLSASYLDEHVIAEAAYAYSKDEAVLTQSAMPLDPAHTYGASSAYARGIVRVLPEVSTGAQVAFSQRASYVIGPTWTAIGLNVHAFDLLTGSFFIDYRPLKELRVAYDLQRQRAQFDRSGILAGGPDANGNPSLIPSLVDPNYTDNRLRAGYRPFDVGWVRAEFRWRFRPDRQERRYGGSVDLDRIGVPGLFVRGYLAYEDISLDNASLPSLSRTLWSGAAGYRNFGLDAEVGASFIERKAGPISARLPDSGDPTKPVDLSPFVLEAERIAFVRAFYANEYGFVGVDAEQSLADSRERRFFLQIGALMEAAW